MNTLLHRAVRSEAWKENSGETEKEIGLVCRLDL